MNNNFPIRNTYRLIKLLQEHFRNPRKVPVRMGLHVGDIVLQEGNAFGLAVNIAARLESMSIAGAILFSNTVNAHIANQPTFESVSLGKFTFKNVENRMEVFALAEQVASTDRPLPAVRLLTEEIKDIWLDKNSD